jgi:hypothetical protein
MKRLGLAVLALIFASPLAAADRAVVLVVNADGPVGQLDPIEIRKVFLGLPVVRGTRALHPIRNVSDEVLVQVFLQDIVAMSQTAYDRRILALVLQQGRPRPLEIKSREQVIAALTSDRYAVSFMWQRDAVGTPGVRILRVLWKD